MPIGTFSKRALDVLNRASEVRNEIDFCSEDGGLQKEIYHFVEWLGDHLRSELRREAWEEPDLDQSEDGISVSLYSPTWRLPDDDYVGFSFFWPNLLDEDSPSVQICVPAEDIFGPRNELMKGLRPKLKLSGFTDHYEEGDPEPSCPLWKYIRLEEFQGESGFDLDSFVVAIVDAFRRLMEVEPLIEDAIRALPEKPPPVPSERHLKTVAFLDTECQGSGNAREMTELGIVNVAYDVDGDEVAGTLAEYCMNTGETLDKTRARSLLERADFIVAHNALIADRPLVARYLPGTEKMHWLCSFRGIEWKQLLGVQGESLKTLMGRTGLRYKQDHHAGTDARDLKRLLALKHNGRTYLGRLLGQPGSGEAPLSPRSE
jgi:hypothetical protein